MYRTRKKNLYCRPCNYRQLLYRHQCDPQLPYISAVFENVEPHSCSFTLRRTIKNRAFEIWKQQICLFLLFKQSSGCFIHSFRWVIELSCCLCLLMLTITALVLAAVWMRRAYAAKTKNTRKCRRLTTTHALFEIEKCCGKEKLEHGQT